MSGYTVKPPTGDSNEQTQFIDYFNLFYSKRGQEQISISQQLGNYGTTFFSASRQSYWNTSRSDQQISFGLNVPFGDITTSLNYSYSNNIWQNDRDHLLAFTLNVPFSHWMRTDSQSAFRNSNASYSMSNDLKGGMTNLSGVYGTLLPDNNLNGTAENIQIELRDDQDAALKNGDSKTVIVDEITRNAQFPLKARAITVNGNASQGTIEALINVIYTWQ